MYRAKQVLGFSDAEFVQTSVYELVHPDDLGYFANAHKERKRRR